MTEPVYRWSPRPQHEMETREGSGPDTVAEINFGAEAWNLAWISHPFESRFPDNFEQFAGAVADTLPCVIQAPATMPAGAQLAMERMLTIPAASFVLVVTLSPDFDKLPIVQLLGPGLKDVWRERTKLARTDHPASLQRMLDYKVDDVQAAEIILRKYRLD